MIKKYFLHLLKWQKVYFSVLFLLLAGFPVLINHLQEKPLLMGGESYYHLEQVREAGVGNYLYLPLKLWTQLVPESVWFILPIILGFFSVLLLQTLGKRWGAGEKEVFFLTLFLIFSPALIFNSLVLTAGGLFVFLLLLGLFLLNQEKKRWKLISAVPVLLAASISVFCSLLLLLALLVYSLKFPSDRKVSGALIAAIILLTILAVSLWHLPLINGPFTTPRLSSDLISDLGGESGMSVFIFILGLIGIVLSWKRKLFWPYFFLPLGIITYFYSTGTVFYLNIIACFFAASAFVWLSERKWRLPAVKQFTIMLLLLGLLFSAISYESRINEQGPAQSGVEALKWIKESTETEGKVFSVPENSYYIRYFAGREPVYNLEQRDLAQKTESETILNSTYITITFPLLEQNNVSIIYVTKEMRQQLPSDKGLLYLLKNEKFKLIHSTEEAEVWWFKKDDSQSH